MPCKVLSFHGHKTHGPRRQDQVMPEAFSNQKMTFPMEARFRMWIPDSNWYSLECLVYLASRYLDRWARSTSHVWFPPADQEHSLYRVCMFINVEHVSCMPTFLLPALIFLSTYIFLKLIGVKRYLTVLDAWVRHAHVHMHLHVGWAFIEYVMALTCAMQHDAFITEGNPGGVLLACRSLQDRRRGRRKRRGGQARERHLKGLAGRWLGFAEAPEVEMHQSARRSMSWPLCPWTVSASF